MNWRKFLLDDFSQRKIKNARFSLRAYAKFLDVSPAHLSQLLSGKRRLSSEVAVRLSDRLELTPSEALRWMRRNHDSKPSVQSLNRTIANEEFSLVSDWHYYAILGLGTCTPNQADPRWIAKRLGISIPIAREAFRKLKELKYIDVNGGQYRPAMHGLRTQDEAPSQQVRRYHKQMLSLAIDAVDSTPIELRELTSVTFGINAKKIHLAKEMIRNFREKFVEEFGAGRKDQVYSINIQLIPLSQ